MIVQVYHLSLCFRMMSHEATRSFCHVLNLMVVFNFLVLYYEHIRLLDHADRLENGHHRYSDVGLKRLKATGMSLSDMLAYIHLFRQGDDLAGKSEKFISGEYDAEFALRWMSKDVRFITRVSMLL